MRTHYGFAWSLYTATPCKNIVVCTLVIFAGPLGIEPRSALLESDILPLYYKPVLEDSSTETTRPQL